MLGDRLVVRPYLGMKGRRTRIIHDFCKTIGIPEFPEVADETTQSNVSIGRIKSTMIAEFNCIWPQFDAEGTFVHSDARDLALHTLLAQPIADYPIEHSRHQLRIIRTMAKDDMAYLEERYFGNSPVFSSYVDDDKAKDFPHEVCFESLPPADLVAISRTSIEALARNR